MHKSNQSIGQDAKEIYQEEEKRATFESRYRSLVKCIDVLRHQAQVLRGRWIFQPCVEEEA